MLEAIIAWDVRLFRLINGEWHAALLDQVLPFVSDSQNYQIPILLWRRSRWSPWDGCAVCALSCWRW